MPNTEKLEEARKLWNQGQLHQSLLIYQEFSPEALLNELQADEIHRFNIKTERLEQLHEIIHQAEKIKQQGEPDKAEKILQFASLFIVQEKINRANRKKLISNPEVFAQANFTHANEFLGQLIFALDHNTGLNAFDKIELPININKQEKELKEVENAVIDASAKKILQLQAENIKYWNMLGSKSNMLHDRDLCFENHIAQQIGQHIVTSNGYFNQGMIENIPKISKHFDMMLQQNNLEGMLPFEKIILDMLRTMKTKQSLKDNFSSISAEHQCDVGQSMVRQILGLKHNVKLTDAHYKQAAFACLCYRSRQAGAGDCFIKGNIIDLTNNSPEMFIEIFQDIVRTGGIIRENRFYPGIPVVKHTNMKDYKSLSFDSKKKTLQIGKTTVPIKDLIQQPAFQNVFNALGIPQKSQETAVLNAIKNQTQNNKISFESLISELGAPNNKELAIQAFQSIQYNVFNAYIESVTASLDPAANKMSMELGNAVERSINAILRNQGYNVEDENNEALLRVRDAISRAFFDAEDIRFLYNQHAPQSGSQVNSWSLVVLDHTSYGNYRLIKNEKEFEDLILTVLKNVEGEYASLKDEDIKRIIKDIRKDPKALVLQTMKNFVPNLQNENKMARLDSPDKWADDIPFVPWRVIRGGDGLAIYNQIHQIDSEIIKIDEHKPINVFYELMKFNDALRHAAPNTKKNTLIPVASPGHHFSIIHNHPTHFDGPPHTTAKIWCDNITKQIAMNLDEAHKKTVDINLHKKMIFQLKSTMKYNGVKQHQVSKFEAYLEALGITPGMNYRAYMDVMSKAAIDFCSQKDLLGPDVVNEETFDMGFIWVLYNDALKRDMVTVCDLNYRSKSSFAGEKMKDQRVAFSINPRTGEFSYFIVEGPDNRLVAPYEDLKFLELPSLSDGLIKLVNTSQTEHNLSNHYQDQMKFSSLEQRVKMLRRQLLTYASPPSKQKGPIDFADIRVQANALLSKLVIDMDTDMLDHLDKNIQKIEKAIEKNEKEVKQLSAAKRTRMIKLEEIRSYRSFLNKYALNTYKDDLVAVEMINHLIKEIKIPSTFKDEQEFNQFYKDTMAVIQKGITDLGAHISESKLHSAISLKLDELDSMEKESEFKDDMNNIRQPALLNRYKYLKNYLNLINDWQVDKMNERRQQLLRDLKKKNVPPPQKNKIVNELKLIDDPSHLMNAIDKEIARIQNIAKQDHQVTKELNSRYNEILTKISPEEHIQKLIHSIHNNISAELAMDACLNIIDDMKDFKANDAFRTKDKAFVMNQLDAFDKRIEELNNQIVQAIALEEKEKVENKQEIKHPTIKRPSLPSQDTTVQSTATPSAGPQSQLPTFTVNDKLRVEDDEKKEINSRLSILVRKIKNKKVSKKFEQLLQFWRDKEKPVANQIRKAKSKVQSKVKSKVNKAKTKIEKKFH